MGFTLGSEEAGPTIFNLLLAWGLIVASPPLSLSVSCKRRKIAQLFRFSLSLSLSLSSVKVFIARSKSVGAAASADEQCIVCGCVYTWSKQRFSLSWMQRSSTALGGWTPAWIS